jgi:hypothetical protein
METGLGHPARGRSCWQLGEKQQYREAVGLDRQLIPAPTGNRWRQWGQGVGIQRK